jgi:hypothetical protein
MDGSNSTGTAINNGDPQAIGFANRLDSKDDNNPVAGAYINPDRLNWITVHPSLKKIIWEEFVTVPEKVWEDMVNAWNWPANHPVQAGLVIIGGELGHTVLNASRGATSRALHEMYKNELRAAMEKPIVSDKALSSIVNKLYRPNAKVGSGSTAAAVRQELITGRSVGRAFHSQKATDSIVELQRWLGRNPTASAADRAAAENLIIDMKNALRGR